MRFVYYSEKTVSQCMIALNERLQAKGVGGRSGLEGWVEKGGRFSLAATTPVMHRFKRTTRLQAKAERGSGITTIEGYVSDGVEPRQRAILYGILVLTGLFVLLSGSVLPGLLALLAPLVLNIPLEGDYTNSQVLLDEIRRTLKARTTPPPAVPRKTGESRRPTAATVRKPAGAKKSISASKSTTAGRTQSRAHTPAKPRNTAQSTRLTR